MAGPGIYRIFESCCKKKIYSRNVWPNRGCTKEYISQVKGLITKKMSECQTKAGNQECFPKLSLSLLSLLLLLSLLSLFHSLYLNMLNNFCFHLYAQNSPSHFLTLTLSLSLSHSHSYTLSISHSITLDMLNNFCFHV